MLHATIICTDIYRCMLCLYRMWEHFLYNCCEGVWRASDLTLMDLCCLLQGVHHYCSGAVVRAGHHVDLRLFPVWGRHDCHVLPVHHTWQPSGRYALCHALSVFQTGWSNSCQKKIKIQKHFFLLVAKLDLYFGFRWGKSMDSSGLDSVHRGRQNTLSSLVHKAKLR